MTKKESFQSHHHRQHSITKASSGGHHQARTTSVRRRSGDARSRDKARGGHGEPRTVSRRRQTFPPPPGAARNTRRSSPARRAHTTRVHKAGCESLAAREVRLAMRVETLETALTSDVRARERVPQRGFRLAYTRFARCQEVRRIGCAVPALRGADSVERRRKAVLEGRGGGREGGLL